MSQAVRGINLAEAKAVLVKFHFTNPKYVPAGLHTVTRKSEQELLRRLMERVDAEAEQQVRGHMVIHNLQMVQAALLRTGLANNGLRLVDAHTTIQQKPGKAPKHLVVTGYRKLEPGETPLPVPAEAQQGLRSLSMDAVWGACHVWWNPNGVMVLEFLMRQQGSPPRHSITTRNGWIVAMPTTRLLEEREEDAQIGSDLLDELTGIRQLIG